ncbi:unnamed protein product [Paramecium sonneborni]|uniref:Transmembrane protein n=1 Tax=Paramecium sonneborni TaxID=65129 RepID=A0A8S1LWX1_9CILI|nr:unnamed protein product [Paramecium sonneborni]
MKKENKEWKTKRIKSLLIIVIMYFTSICNLNIEIFKEMQVEQIFEGYFQTQNEQNKINLDNINQYAEILEIQQLTINYIISNLHARSFDLQLIDQITPLIDFDPLGVAAKEEKNPYDDEYYPVKVSDSTWRVRRLLSALFGPNQIIMKRINEKMLKSNYQLLISLVQASAITKEDINSMEVEQLSLIKQRSIPASISLIELVEQLLDKIQSIFKNDQKQQSLKSESTKLLLAIGQYFYSQIQTSNSCFTQIQINQLLVQLFIIKMNKKEQPEVEDFFNLINQPLIVEEEIIKPLGKEKLYTAGQIYCSILKNSNGSISNLYSLIETNRQLKLSTLRFRSEFGQGKRKDKIDSKYIIRFEIKFQRY